MLQRANLPAGSIRGCVLLGLLLGVGGSVRADSALGEWTPLIEHKNQLVLGVRYSCDRLGVEEVWIGAEAVDADGRKPEGITVQPWRVRSREGWAYVSLWHVGRRSLQTSRLRLMMYELRQGARFPESVRARTLAHREIPFEKKWKSRADKVGGRFRSRREGPTEISIVFYYTLLQGERRPVQASARYVREGRARKSEFLGVSGPLVSGPGRSVRLLIGLDPDLTASSEALLVGLQFQGAQDLICAKLYPRDTYWNGDRLIAEGHPSALWGFWESEKRDASGLGDALEFRQDGTVRQIIGHMLDFGYERREDRLTLEASSRARGLGTLGPFGLSVLGDTMVLDGLDGERRKERAAPQSGAGSSIRGVWSYDHPSGARSYEHYDREGRMALRVPLRVNPGTWEASSRSERDSPFMGLTITVPRGDPMSFSSIVDGSQLRLMPRGNRSPDGILYYRRVSRGAWYPADTKPASGLAARWRVTIRVEGRELLGDLLLRQDGSRLSGTWERADATIPAEQIDGSLDDGRIEFGFETDRATTTFAGEVSGGTMSGTVVRDPVEPSEPTLEFPWKARRTGLIGLEPSSLIAAAVPLDLEELDAVSLARSSEIVGRWVSVGGESPGEERLEFACDGTVRMESPFWLEYEYEIQRGRLVLRGPDSGDSEHGIALEGDELTLEGPDWVLRLRRDSPPHSGRHPIVGTWKQAGAVEFSEAADEERGLWSMFLSSGLTFEFTADGRSIWRSTQRSEGTYSREGDLVEIRLEKVAQVRLGWIEGESLILRVGDSEVTFERAPVDPAAGSHG
jgi:hypothetical protein